MTTSAAQRRTAEHDQRESNDSTVDLTSFERYLRTRYQLDSIDADPVIRCLQMVLAAKQRTRRHKKISTDKSYGGKIIVMPILERRRAAD